MTSTGRTGAARESGAGVEGPMRRSLWALLLLLPTLVGCSLDGLLKSDEVPPDVADPALTDTPAGALIAYRGTLVQLRAAYGGSEPTVLTGAGSAASANRLSSVVLMGGRLSDELDKGLGSTAVDPVDRRTLLAVGNDDAVIRNAYSTLQLLRNQAGLAIGLLRRHVLEEEPALLAHMYAVQAYSEIFLAELFCSGIPLSTVDFDGDYTPRSGSPTEEVFNHARALLDTGLTLAADSVRFLNLIRVGQGRALLALGRYAEAAAVVDAVPDTFRYAVSYSSTASARAQNFMVGFANTSGWEFSVSDREGLTGLDYRTSIDSRTRVTEQKGPTTGPISVTNFGKTVYRPNKYLLNGSSSIVLASGIEARLIKAEAALQAKDYTTWIDELNRLRQTAYPTIVNCVGAICTPAASPLVPDLVDPGPDGSGTDDLREDLLFRERAFWLFLTGHRQGDLRRLIRQYGRNQAQVYPSGSYPGGGFYGTDVVVPVPGVEQALNPLYTGCSSTSA